MLVTAPPQTTLGEYTVMSTIKLEQANKIIAVALAKAREMKLTPVGVAVLDAGGHLVALQREDGLSFLRVQICQAKAWGALGVATHSRHIGERYQKGETQQGFIIALNAMTGGNVIPLPGGVLIRDKDGDILGAVGVSGAASEDDETCAAEGIQAVGYTVDLES